MKLYSLILLPTYTWYGVSVAASTFTPPVTFGEVLTSLRRLGYEDAKELTLQKNLFHQGTTGNGSTTGECLKTCAILGYVLGDLVNTPGTSFFVQQQSAYWSAQQSETLPACRVQPRYKNDVAAALIVTSFFKCPFAVKSGGHGAFAGASNIQDGLTIDLNNLKTIKVSKDRTITQVGAGNRWVDVYSALLPLNLAVIGGRVADIGVGGLTLGGGISYLTSRHGFACDGVKNYEVIFANGEVKQVNTRSYPEVYWALRGGGNNFGIVTRFDLATFEQGLLWGGYKVYPGAAFNASIIKALHNFANNAPQDPDAAVIAAFGYAEGQYLANSFFSYGKPVVDPPILDEFKEIEPIFSTMRVANLTDLTLELKSLNPTGLRETYTTATFKNSVVILTKILEIFIDELDGVIDAAGLRPALVLQPITKSAISYFSRNGGNALGIDESDGPLIRKIHLFRHKFAARHQSFADAVVVMSLSFMWSSKNDDTRIYACTKRVIDRAVAAAKELHLDYKFIYQNYASFGQDVFASYGKANHDRLVRISKKYDPEQIFQKLQPGYFKLNG